MPATDLLAAHLAHVVPVGGLLLTGRLGAEREPADGLLLLHAALVVDGDEQRHVRQLEQRHLWDGASVLLPGIPDSKSACQVEGRQYRSTCAVGGLGCRPGALDLDLD